MSAYILCQLSTSWDTFKTHLLKQFPYCRISLRTQNSNIQIKNNYGKKEKQKIKINKANRSTKQTNKVKYF